MLSSVATITLLVFLFAHNIPTKNVQESQTEASEELEHNRAEHFKMERIINEEKSMKMKESQQIQRSLGNIALVLKLVADEYNEERKKLYCSTRKHVWKLRCGGEDWMEIFQQLMNFEKLLIKNEKHRISPFQEHRINLLKKLRISFKKLTAEIPPTDLTLQKSCNRSERMRFLNTETNLILREWQAFEKSREFVNYYLGDINEIYQCWQNSSEFGETGFDAGIPEHFRTSNLIL